MSNHRRQTVEWLLRAVEMAAVFSAMSWALIWVATHRRSAVETAPGHRLDSADPDGAASLERGRRRRHIY
jgi:hypothetical protein